MDSNSFSPLTFTADVKGTAPSSGLTFNWSVSAGRIVSGQRAPSVTVNTSEFPGGYVTATVEVNGLPGGCPGAASCTTTVIRDPLPRKIDEYGDISPSAERPRLHRFAVELRKDPYAEAYILSYAGRRAWAGEAKWRAERVKRYLTRNGGINRSRIVIIDGGHRESREMELYLVPSSSIGLPIAAPTVEPSEVKIIGRRRERPLKP